MKIGNWTKIGAELWLKHHQATGEVLAKLVVKKATKGFVLIQKGKEESKFPKIVASTGSKTEILKIARKHMLRTS